MTIHFAPRFVEHNLESASTSLCVVYLMNVIVVIE